jgi:hypothetical protein
MFGGNRCCSLYDPIVIVSIKGKEVYCMHPKDLKDLVQAAFPDLTFLFLASFIITLPINAETPAPPTKTRPAGRATAYSLDGKRGRRGELEGRNGCYVIS